MFIQTELSYKANKALSIHKPLFSFRRCCMPQAGQDVMSPAWGYFGCCLHQLWVCTSQQGGSETSTCLKGEEATAFCCLVLRAQLNQDVLQDGYFPPLTWLLEYSTHDAFFFPTQRADTSMYCYQPLLVFFLNLLPYSSLKTPRKTIFPPSF